MYVKQAFKGLIRNRVSRRNPPKIKNDPFFTRTSRSVVDCLSVWRNLIDPIFFTFSPSLGGAGNISFSFHVTVFKFLDTRIAHPYCWFSIKGTLFVSTNVGFPSAPFLIIPKTATFACSLRSSVGTNAVAFKLNSTTTKSDEICLTVISILYRKGSSSLENSGFEITASHTFHRLPTCDMYRAMERSGLMSAVVAMALLAVGVFTEAL